jgi:RNA polymerase primary sigma factor
MPSAAHRHRVSRDSVTTYLDEIGRYPLLSREAELDLARRARLGDSTALDRLICANLRFVVAIAKRYQTRGVPLIDLINEGNLGLVEAAERFDETKGVKLISYAVWWVRQMIFHLLAQQGHAVRIPMRRAGTLVQLGRRAEGLRQAFGREPTQEEIGAACAMTDDELTDTLPLARSSVSLDAALVDGGDATLLDRLPSEDIAAPDQGALDAALGDSVEQALAALSPRESRVVRLHFGFDGGDAMSFEAIGRQMGITRERVRQIHQRALRKLRKSIHRQTLAEYRE